jgi:hypothetical protein
VRHVRGGGPKGTDRRGGLSYLATVRPEGAAMAFLLWCVSGAQIRSLCELGDGFDCGSERHIPF